MVLSNIYEAIADATDDELVKSVMQEVADEEKVHAGEFQKLLEIMLDDEEGFMDEGRRRSRRRVLPPG